MADNPFLEELNQINGIVIENGHFIGFSPENVGGGSDDDTLELTGASSPLSAGQITVTNFEYVPGHVYYGNDVLPIFGQIEFSNDAGINYNIVGFTENGILLTTVSVPTVQDGVYSFAAGGGAFISFDLAFDEIAYPITFEVDPAVFCFVEGVRIETPAGLVAVEDLSEGDMVITQRGVPRPIRWIGQLVSRPARHPRPSEVNPVCVHAHAFGPDLPARAVRLSPGHAVYVDGVLVPVGALVNGATIVQEEVETVRYFHVELDSHDVLLAEGLPCESYLDDGNRASFAGAGTVAELHGRLDPKTWDDACAPLVADGPQLLEIQQRLLVQAEALGWVRSEQSNLVIVADDVEIGPASIVGDRYRFEIQPAATLLLRSKSGTLSHVMPGISDRRVLGVAVSELLVDGEALDLASEVFGSGFHPVERSAATDWRWTDGDATLRLALSAPAVVELRLLMVAPTWGRDGADRRLAA